jgi:hypothetical protein
MTFWSLFWYFISIFAFIAYLFALFSVIIDLFRDISSTAGSRRSGSSS